MIEIKTYTNVWNADRKIYRFQDLNLPMPISFKQIGLFFVGGILWFPIAFFVLPLSVTSAWGFILIFGPPVALAVLGDKPIFGGKTITQAATSEIRFWFESKFLKDYEPANPKKEESVYAVSHQVWHSLDSFRQIDTPSSEQDGKEKSRISIHDVLEAGNRTTNYDKIFKSLNGGRAA